jgi:hypothetical protein
MVLERTSSSLAAKIATVVYIVVCSIVLPLAVAGGVLSEVVIRTCVEQPQGPKVAAFRQGTKTYYTYPGLLAWRRAAALFVAPGVFVLLTSGGVAWWLRRKAARPAP